MKKLSLASAALLAVTVAVPSVADAQPYGRAHGYYNNSAHARDYQRDRYYDGRYSNRYANRYDDRYSGRYADRYEDGYSGRTYGYQERDRCRSGTTGTIVGGAAGALLGREVAGRGDRTLGTIIGGLAGALGGRAVTRDSNCR